PHAYNYTPPAGAALTNRRNAAHPMRVHDARAIADRLTLDREGFALRRSVSAVKDFYDDAEVKSVYYPECERLLRETTGAVRAVTFDHIVRCAPRSKED